LARQINLICVPQLMGVQGPLAAQIGYVRAIRVGHVLWVAGGRCHRGTWAAEWFGHVGHGCR